MEKNSEEMMKKVLNNQIEKEQSTEIEREPKPVLSRSRSKSSDAIY